MTKAEALELLKKPFLCCDLKCYSQSKENCERCEQAFDMAIEAIQQMPKRGKWRKRKIKEHQFIQNGYELYYCSECYKNYSNTVGVEGFDYCPNCGAKMESDEQ
jgi:phosphoribosyl-dephospho-CoA transferase